MFEKKGKKSFQKGNKDDNDQSALLKSRFLQAFKQIDIKNEWVVIPFYEQ